MFEYGFTRNAVEYTARLRKEAHDARLVRGAASPLAKFAARTFRAWANRIDAGASKRAETNYDGWILDSRHHESHLIS